jgi:hypothetical protein
MIGFIDTSSQLHLNITALTQWIPYERCMSDESRTDLYATNWVSVWVWVMLRPTVSRPVCLGTKHPSGAYDQIFITDKQLRVCWCGALSLTRERVCLLYMQGPAQSFSGPSPLVLLTIFYCLRFETSLFVASYDSQCYGGNIRPRHEFKSKSKSHCDWVSVSQ